MPAIQNKFDDNLLLRLPLYLAYGPAPDDDCICITETNLYDLRRDFSTNRFVAGAKQEVAEWLIAHGIDFAVLINAWQVSFVYRSDLTFAFTGPQHEVFMLIKDPAQRMLFKLRFL